MARPRSCHCGHCRKCRMYGKNLGSANGNWRGDEARARTGYGRAERAFSLEGVTCEWCGKQPAEHRHHHDYNPLNNERANVALVCGHCHLSSHAPERDIRPCDECGGVEQIIRHGRKRGLCPACYERRRYKERKERALGQAP